MARKDLFEESPPRVEVICAIKAHNFAVGPMATFVAQVFYITAKQLNVRTYEKSGFRMKIDMLHIQANTCLAIIDSQKLPGSK